jgi:hypothetical protein
MAAADTDEVVLWDVAANSAKAIRPRRRRAGPVVLTEGSAAAESTLGTGCRFGLRAPRTDQRGGTDYRVAYDLWRPGPRDWFDCVLIAAGLAETNGKPDEAANVNVKDHESR